MSARLQPATATAPALTTTAPVTSRAEGRPPRASGPATASTTGTQATAAPNTPGSVCRVPSTTARVNRTSPDRAPATTHTSSLPRGGTSRTRRQRATTTTPRAATAYRADWTANVGRWCVAPVTATVPPSKTMPPKPGSAPLHDGPGGASSCVMRPSLTSRRTVPQCHERLGRLVQ